MITRTPRASRYSHLYRGVYPFLFPEPKPDVRENWQLDVDARLKWGMLEAEKLGILAKGDTVVAVQGWKGGLGHTNTYVPHYKNSY